MFSWLLILCFILCFTTVYTYGLYPFILSKLKPPPLFKQFDTSLAASIADKPCVLLFAMYNEEIIVRQKLESVFASTNIEISNLQIYIGNDNSSDSSVQIVEEFQKRFPNQIHLIHFPGRCGKILIMNSMIERIQTEFSADTVCILTDANVIHTPDSIAYLCDTTQKVPNGIVSANVLNPDVYKSANAGEFYFIASENALKYAEGELWGYSMGAFGACYSVLLSNLRPTHPNFFNDDFFRCFELMQEGQACIVEWQAVVFEDLPSDWKIEYRRKRRISNGNMQNIFYFPEMLNPFKHKLAWVYWSHKVVRWIIPVFAVFIAVFTVLCLILEANYWVWSIFAVQISIGLSPFVFRIWPKGIQMPRLISSACYFVSMHYALLAGYVQYIKNRKRKTIWIPTERNV